MENGEKHNHRAQLKNTGVSSSISCHIACIENKPKTPITLKYAVYLWNIGVDCTGEKDSCQNSRDAERYSGGNS